MSIPFRPASRALLPAALSALLLFGGSAGISAAAASPVEAASIVRASIPAAPAQDSAADYALFLKEKFGVALGDAPTRGEFFSQAAAALKPAAADKAAFDDLTASSPYYAAIAAFSQAGLIAGTAVHPEQTLSAINAAQFAVKASGLAEVAQSYPADKADKALAGYGLSVQALGLQGARELAAAVDSGLVPGEYANLIKDRKPVTADYAAVLLGKTLTVLGGYKHYIGSTFDPAIYAELLDAYRTSDIVKAPELQKIGDAALERELVTGYTIRDSRYESNFIESLSLTYGHSDIKHAEQLIALLRSEGIDAKVQYEPRTSAFVYLKEWGEPGVSETYEVKQIANGNYIEYAKEYELLFEFGNSADRDRFDAIINRYAKKNSDDTTGLLYGSWWQPLYYSNVQPQGDYKQITNNKLSDGRYYLESFSLNDKSAEIVSAFQTVDPTVKVDTYTFWTNAAFYRYLNGESK